MQKIKQYNPQWEKFLIPYIDGINRNLPDNNNLELDYKDLDIGSFPFCIVGDYWKNQGEYWIYYSKDYCESCTHFANSLELLYYRDLENRDKQNSDILSSFKHTLELFYEHVDKVHKA